MDEHISEQNLKVNVRNKTKAGCTGVGLESQQVTNTLREFENDRKRKEISKTKRPHIGFLKRKSVSNRCRRKIVILRKTNE